jgi:GT2 family glycosyltransferase
LTASSSAQDAPLLSVVIPTYNASRLIGEQLEALTAQTYEGPIEVVIADNMSTDDLEGAIRPFNDRLNVRRIAADGRRGVSHARNRGCKAATADEKWAESMVDALAADDLVGGHLDVARLNPVDVQRWRPLPEDRLPTAMSFLPYAPGANCGLRRRVFEKLGGWDEGLVAGGDDMDFGWRAQLNGFTLGYAPEAVVHYRLRTSLRATARQVAAYSAANAGLLLRFRDAGVAPRPVRRLLHDFSWLLTRSPYALMRGSWRQGLWFMKAAWLWGRVRGSLRSRVWAL